MDAPQFIYGRGSATCGYRYELPLTWEIPLQISPDEMKTFASAFSDKSKAEESGVSFGGSKYFFTKLEDLTHESLPERTIPTLHVAKVIINIIYFPWYSIR